MVRGQTNPVQSRRLGRDATAFHIQACRVARRLGVLFSEPTGRPAVGGLDLSPLVASAVPAGRGLQTDSCPIRQDAQGLGESDTLVKLDELEDVARDIADEAMEDPLFGYDMKRGRLLVVKRSQGLELASGRSQGHVGPDDLHDVAGLTNPFFGGLGRLPAHTRSIIAVKSAGSACMHKRSWRGASRPPRQISRFGLGQL